MNISTKISWLFLVWLLFILSMMLMVYAHEHAHRDVYNNYNINSTIEYNLNPFAKTFWTSEWAGRVTPTSNNTRNCDTGCDQTHAQIEVVSNFLEYLVTLFFILLVIIIAIYPRNS